MSGASKTSFTMGSLSKDGRCRSNCNSRKRGRESKSSRGTRRSADLTGFLKLSAKQKKMIETRPQHHLQPSTSSVKCLPCLLAFWALANWCCRNCVTLWLTSCGIWFCARKRRKSRNCDASSSLRDLKPAMRSLMVLISVAVVIRALKAMMQFKNISVVFEGCKGLSPTPSWQKDHNIHIKYWYVQ